MVVNPCLCVVKLTWGSRGGTLVKAGRQGEGKEWPLTAVGYSHAERGVRLSPNQDGGEEIPARR